MFVVNGEREGKGGISFLFLPLLAKPTSSFFSFLDFSIFSFTALSPLGFFFFFLQVLLQVRFKFLVLRKRERERERERQRKALLLKTARRGLLGLLDLLLLLGSLCRRGSRFRRRFRLKPLLLPLAAPPGSPRPSSRSPPWPSRRATRCCGRASRGPRRASRAEFFFEGVSLFQREFFFLRRKP